MWIYTEVDTELKLQQGCEVVAVCAGPVLLDKITHLSEFPKVELIAEYVNEQGVVCREPVTLPYPAPITVAILKEIKVARQEAQAEFDLAAAFERALNIFHHDRYNQRWEYRNQDIHEVLENVQFRA